MSQRTSHTDRLSFDVAVVGAGPAGLAAACAAAASGARVCVFERQQFAGGVLPQCVHDGFGIHLYGSALTGPEYAQRWERHATEQGARMFLGTTVLKISRIEAAGGSEAWRQGYELSVVGAELMGAASVLAHAVVVATGCRERTRGQMLIAGTRPAGVMTAGAAQYLMNVENRLPGTLAVILGSGDVGLIMARRLTLEGAQVRMVLGQRATGLLRNQIRCIDDYGIPERFGWGVARIHGRGQLKGVTIAPLLSDGGFDMDRHEYVRCNLLLLACGLIPEREVVEPLFGDRMPAAGDGASDDLSSEGVFVCGNAHMPYDLVDQVTQEGLRAGERAARFAMDTRRGGVAPGSVPADGVRRAEFAAYAKRLVEKRVSEPKGRLADLEGAMPAACRPVACTVCPTGCIMQVDEEGAVAGNVCSRGAEFALAELSSPTRLFTGTVKVKGAADGRPLVPVRTATEVPRDAMLRIARVCRRITAQAPIEAGQAVRRNVAGTGVDLIATARVCAERSGVSRAACERGGA